MAWQIGGTAITPTPINDLWKEPDPSGYDGNGGPVYVNSGVVVTWTFRAVPQGTLLTLRNMVPSNGATIGFNTRYPAGTTTNYEFRSCSGVMHRPQAQGQYLVNNSIGYWETVELKFTKVAVV